MSEINRGIGKEKELLKAGMPTTNHLLVIGINKYQHGIPVLNNAVRDAQAFETLLNEKYDFKSENINSLYDEEATTDKILASFDTLRNKLTSDDNLIIYFSGHGELVEASQRGYWIPVDARLAKRGDYINNIEVTDFIKTCKARHVLGIIDACYSGALLRKVSSPLLDKLYTRPSRKLMTSGLIEPVPDGLPNNHSPFSAALLTVLKHNTQPYLSAAALWQEMQEGLATNSFATGIYEPMHNVGHQGGEFFFLSNETETIPPAEAPPIVDENPKEGVARNVNVEEPVKIAINSLSDLKKALRQLMAQGQAKDAFELLLGKLDEGSTHMTTIYLRLSNLNGLERDIAAGIATNIPQQKAQINHALDYIISNLTEEDFAK